MMSQKTTRASFVTGLGWFFVNQPTRDKKKSQKPFKQTPNPILFVEGFMI